MNLFNFIRNIPHFKGKFRIIKVLNSKFLNESKDITINGKHNLTYLLPNLKENIGFEIYSDGIYEPETIDHIIDKIDKEGVFLDIGANIGSIIMPVCKIKPEIKAICIEGSPRVFSYLKKNITQNKIENCILINNIISDKDDELVDFYSPIELFGKGSMSPVFTSDSEKVATITIDTLLGNLNISKVDFIKIDIEGFEYFAFAGAKNLLKSQNAPDISFEFIDWAESKAHNLLPGSAQDLLFSYGYRLFIIQKGGNFTEMKEAMKKGEAMIFATKKQI